METYLGLDIGTSSIGFALVKYDKSKWAGEIIHAGVRIFPEALEGKSEESKKPKNIVRRTKRLIRRQIRHRKLKRIFIRKILHGARLLPSSNSRILERLDEKVSPFELRTKALSEKLEPHELGRVLTHLSRRTGFVGSPKLSIDETSEKNADATKETEKEEKKYKDAIVKLQNQMESYETLGAYLSKQKKQRNHKIEQRMVRDEFEKIWSVQTKYHRKLLTDELKTSLQNAIFYQRPIFWRWKSIGKCRLEPSSPLLMKADWRAQQFITLQTLNNLGLTGGNQRKLTPEERNIVYQVMMRKKTVTFGGLRKALKKHWKEKGIPTNSKFNLEVGADERENLPGNALEALLHKTFGDDLTALPAIDQMRKKLAQYKWNIEYRKILKGYNNKHKGWRIEVRNSKEIDTEKQKFIQNAQTDWKITKKQAQELADAPLPGGWTRFSEKVINRLLPSLENGEEMTTVLDKFYPRNEQLRGEELEKLPSHHKTMPDARNPVVIRCLNEARKVVNNLLDEYGKPDYIRIEMARDVKLAGKAKAKALKININRRKKRKEAQEWLENKNQNIPTNQRIPINDWTILKHMLWKESNGRCLYSGSPINFSDLFCNNRFQIEHIMPKIRSRDDSYNNLLLCERDYNARKADRTPFEAFGNTDEWESVVSRVTNKKLKLPKAKIRRFLREQYTGAEDHERANSQLSDTAYAARLVRDFIAVLYPKGEAIDWGKNRPPRVQVVNGRITSQLGRAWNIYREFNKKFRGQDDDFKNRDDHRHHALDAIAIALTTPDLVKYVSRRYNEERKKGKDYETIETQLRLRRPWNSFHQDVHAALRKIIVSYRVDSKVSGVLSEDKCLSKKRAVKENQCTYFIKRIDLKEATPEQIRSICDGNVKQAVWQHILKYDDSNLMPQEPAERPDGKNKKKVNDAIKKAIQKAFQDDVSPPRMPRKKIAVDGAPEPGPIIRHPRVKIKQQPHLTVPINEHAIALKGDNHHIALYQKPDGDVITQVVSKLEALQRIQQGEPIVMPEYEGNNLLFSLCKRDMLEYTDPETGEINYLRIDVLGEKQTTLYPHTEAGKKLKMTPQNKTLGGDYYRKISVDPIGRIRAAK